MSRPNSKGDQDQATQRPGQPPRAGVAAELPKRPDIGAANSRRPLSGRWMIPALLVGTGLWAALLVWMF